MVNKSHLTAIVRKDLSLPTKFLLERGYLKEDLLDYGCGRGGDVLILRNIYQINSFGYDPNLEKLGVYNKGLFDNNSTLFKRAKDCYNTITCHYVLNVVLQSEEKDILKHIQSYLKPNGNAYITCRADYKNCNGWTSKGTFQRKVELQLPLVMWKKNSWKMWRLTKNDSL